MSYQPLVSIIIPVYNVAEYISSCINSVLQQSYPNIEIIIVNDGSTDNSLEICQSFEKRHPHILVIDQVNKGLSNARNTGIENSKGEYIAFVDSDDIIHPDYILHLLLSIEDDDISICRLKKFEQEIEIDFSISPSKVVKQKYTGTQANSLLYDHSKGIDMAVATNKLYRKEIWKKFKFPEGRLHEDIAIMYQIYDRVTQLSFIEVDLYYYRIRKNSITNGRSFKSIKDEYLALTEQIDFFSKKGQMFLKRNANRARKALFLEKSLDYNWQVWKNYSIYDILSDDLRTKVKIQLIIQKINSKVSSLIQKK